MVIALQDAKHLSGRLFRFTCVSTPIRHLY